MLSGLWSELFGFKFQEVSMSDKENEAINKITWLVVGAVAVCVVALVVAGTLKFIQWMF